MIVTENTPERIVIVEPVQATGVALTWISPIQLTLKMLMLKTPKLRELASEWVFNPPSGALGFCLNYPNLRKIPFSLGFISYFIHRFESERETVVDFQEQALYLTERGFFAQNQKAISLQSIESLIMEKNINWKEQTPTDCYRLYLRVSGRKMLFFEHMDKCRVEELLRRMATRLQLR